MRTRIYQTAKIGNKRVVQSFSLKDAGLLAILYFPFWFAWIVVKWSFIAMFYMVKWPFYSLPKWIIGKIKGKKNETPEG